MTVHDEYVPTGLQRTFPNLFCTEGILGDEGIGRNSDPQIAQDIATLFTRTIQGPADHTYCWPGKGTKAYALASPPAVPHRYERAVLVHQPEQRAGAGQG